MTDPALSIVIPALNEERGIGAIIDRTLAVEPALCRAGLAGLELIIVDDGSTDRTAAIVAGYPQVRLLRHPHNRGYGAALKTGFAAAGGEWVAFLDADGTYPPEYFPNLIEAGLHTPADLVIGSRMAGAASQMPAMRRLGNLIFARLLTIVAGVHVSDSASGMRVLRHSVLQQLYPLPDGLNFTPVMSTRALHEQLRVVETPIPYSERVGRSKLSVVRDGWRFAQSIVWTALSYNPARLLAMLGGGALAIAALIALGLIVARLSGIDTVSALGAFLLFFGLVLAVAGVSLLSLGVSFNYFVALFHKHPVRQSFGNLPLVRRPDRTFGWLGLGALTLGVLIGLGALVFAFQGVTEQRLWLYYLASAGFVLIGVQLVVAWIQMQVLDALSLRADLVRHDLGELPATNIGELPVTNFTN